MFLWEVVTGLSETVTYLDLPVGVDDVEQAEDFLITSYSDFPGLVLDRTDVGEGELGSKLFEELDLSCNSGQFLWREVVQEFVD